MWEFIIDFLLGIYWKILGGIFVVIRIFVILVVIIVEVFVGFSNV